MKHEIVAKRVTHLAFNAHIDNHLVRMDTEKQFGGNNEGPQPKPLLLAALAGCTGMDVVALMNKMRISFEDIDLVVSGELTEEHPKYYHKIHIVYEILGNNLDLAQIEKAVTLSQEKYCGVTYMLRQAATITWEIRLKEMAALS
ncbi:MAG: OsmC family protein [Bacteroidia bacterium]|nr:OsmC family protein [Bacteroidia bacterium]